MTSPTDRIAAVLREHRSCIEYPRGEPRCTAQGCDWIGHDHHAHVAERVVAELPELTPFWAIADGEGGISEECFDQLDRAEELLADWLDAGYTKAHLVTTSFTGWAAVEEKP